MRILAIERPVEGADAARFTPELRADEARQAWRLYQAGVIRELYFHADEPMAVIVLECADVAEAGTALETLPMVSAGLIEFDVLPLRAYPGFARLFETVMGGLEAAGVMTREKRPFRPHLTIARLRMPSPVQPRYESGRASYAIESVCLYRSELSREGARYSVVARAVFDEKSGWKV